VADLEAQGYTSIAVAASTGADEVSTLRARVEVLEEALFAANKFIQDKHIPYEPRMHDWLDVMTA